MKKKLTLAAACILAAFSTYAQTSDQESFKPTVGTKTLETNLWYSNYGGNIRLRKFKSETFAFRHNLSAQVDRSKVKEDGVRSGFTVRYAPGIEKHFTGTNRLSPYFGLELPLTFKQSHYKDDELEIKNATSYYNNNTSYDTGYYGVGLNGLGGVDYYVAKNFYVGLEAGIGISYQKYRDTKVYNNGSTMPINTIEGFGSTSLATFTSGVRIGFAF